MLDGMLRVQALGTRSAQGSYSLHTETLYRPPAACIGIALALFGKLDDPLGEDRIGMMAPLGIKGYARRLECKADDTFSLSVEWLTLKQTETGMALLRQHAAGRRNRFDIDRLCDR